MDRKKIVRIVALVLVVALFVSLIPAVLMAALG